MAARVAVALLLLAAGPLPGLDRAAAGTLIVRVLDARTGDPLPGAYVQVGPAPGNPFPGNWGSTGPRGGIMFTHALLVGGQTVTAGADGFSLLTVIRAVADSITIPLSPQTAESGAGMAQVEVAGTIPGLATRSNDGHLDLAIVYPALELSEILGARSSNFSAPPDTVQFPIIGRVVLPGNVSVPGQTEFLVFPFAKPRYRLLLPESRPYRFAAIVGRVPLSSLGGGRPLPMNAMTMREIRVQRPASAPVGGALHFGEALPLDPSLTVSVPEAPPGAEVFVATVADLSGNGSGGSVLLDAKTALRDTLTAFRLSGLNPVSELAGARPFLAAFYADTSAAGLFQAGRIDRTPLALPAHRLLDGFYDLPQLYQDGEVWCWSEVSSPGGAPPPTWSRSTFRLAAARPGDIDVPERLRWEVWVPAQDLSFQLPFLAAEAPGGSLDPGATSGEDQLYWDCWVGDPAGPLQAVLANGYARLTRWSRSTTEAIPPPAAPEEFGLGTRGGMLRFRVLPNPGPAPRDLTWERPLPRGSRVVWSIVGPGGRQIAAGSFVCSGEYTEALVWDGLPVLPTGVYWVRIEADTGAGSIPLVVVR